MQVKCGAGLRTPERSVYSILANTELLYEVPIMSGELDIDGRELLAMSEEAPDQVEAIIEMMIEAGEDLFAEEEEE